MKRDILRKSFTRDEHNHFQVDKSLIFTETDRQRHDLCLKLLDTIKHSVSTFRPSDSLACLPSLLDSEGSSRDNLYDYFVPEDDHFPISSLAEDASPNNPTSSLGGGKKIKKPKAEIDLVISGGGLKGYFMTGCSHILKHELKKQNISIRRIAGASAGAWCGLFMMTDFSTSNWIETYYLCQERLHMTMHEAYEEMWPWIESILPENAYEICTGRLFISVTEVTWFGLKNHMISEYKSNRDLFNACLASSTVPYISLPTALFKYRDMWVVDGGVTNNTPIFPDLPRRVLVFRLTDVFYPVKLLIHPKDACIEALVVRGAIQMSRFLQGATCDSFSWVEYEKAEGLSPPSTLKIEEKLNNAGIIRKSPRFRQFVNIVYYSIVIGGSMYTVAHYVEKNLQISIWNSVFAAINQVRERFEISVRDSSSAFQPLFGQSTKFIQ